MKIKQILTIGLRSISFVLCLTILSDRVKGQDTEVTTRSTWRIEVALDVPSLVPPAVQWAVFDANPIPGFVDKVETGRPHHQFRLEQAKDAAEKELERLVAMTYAWNSGFSVVTGDHVYLLTSPPPFFHSLSSNKADGDKWIVTKIVRIKRKPVCWCLPIKVKTGETIKVTLTEENAFKLESTFDEALGTPEGKD